MPDLAVVDRGYRGHGVNSTKVLISGLTPFPAKLLKRRRTIEPESGHMKADGHLARCPLKGRSGDAVFAVLCAPAVTISARSSPIFGLFGAYSCTLSQRPVAKESPHGGRNRRLKDGSDWTI